MRKKLLIAMSAITMLFATSCQNDLDLGIETGKEALVSFNVTTPDMATRAYGEGSAATKLQYAVYDANGDILPDLTKTDATINVGTTTEVKLNLITGDTYSIIFWAAAPDAPYKVVLGTKTMSVNYDGAKSNDESRDAFYAYVEPFAVNGAQTINVELTRPFAQLNIGTNDYDKAEAVGFVPTQSTVTVKQVYSTLNLATGEVEDPQNVIFGLADINKVETFPVTGYKYLAMNYLLVGADQELVDIEFACTNGSKEKSRKVGSVPVRRNYRTNIYGSILTSDVKVNVDIDPAFEGTLEDVANMVYNVTELQAALDAAPVGETTTIYLAQDIKGNVTEVQKADRRIVIEGGGNKYEGSIKVHANSYYYSDAAFTIKDVNFTTDKASVNFIEALENGSERYSSNITVDGCTFTATGDAANTAVGVQVKATRGVTVMNCTATNMHSLIQAQSCDTGDVKVINSTVNGKNGVAFKQVKAATVEDTKITALGYGIRFDGNTDNYGIVAKNINVNAVQPFIVRRMTGNDNTIALEGSNTLTVATTRAATEAPAYQIVITNGEDDAEYVKPTGTYTLTGADDFLVYPRDYAFPVASWDEFTAALAAGEGKVMLTADITYDANYQLQKSVEINLNGKSMTLPMINIHTATTIKRGTINGKVYARKNSDIVFDRVTFSGAVSDNLSTEGHLAIQSGCKLYAKDCLFSPTSVSGSQTKPISFEGGSSTMKFENCEFKSSPYKKQVYFNPLSATATLDFTNCNFNNKTPNIMFAAACPLTNVTMSGTTKLSSVTFEINRAKDAVTEEDLAYLRTMIANNSFSSVRLFYAGGSSEYIR